MTTGSSEYAKPLPRAENPPLTQPFWDAAKRHELIIPRCKTCDKPHFYPREQCPWCASKELEWVPASGKGRLHSYTVIRQPVNRNFQPDVPYAYCIIQLDEGVRMISNLVGCRIPEDLKMDMPVVAEFDDVTPDWTLVKFKPA